MIETTVTATIGMVNSGIAIVVISYTIIAIDGEEPAIVKPRERTEEIVRSSENGILPIVEDVAKVCIAVGQIISIDIVCRLDAEQIVEVDLIAVVVLLIIEIQFVGHLVREETGLLASLSIAHCGE